MDIVTAINKVYSLVQTKDQRQKKDLKDQDILIQYISSFSSQYIHEFVMQLQNLITANIVVGVVNMELLKECVTFLDILHWVNQDLITKQEDRIEVKEFHNEAVNNNLDLKPSMVNWAKYTKI